MSKYERLIAELQGSMRADEQELGRAHIDLGRLLIERRSGVTMDPTLEELAGRAEGPAAEAERLRQRMGQIRERAAEITNIDAELRQTERRIETVERRNEPLYETIGESAYQMYRQTPRAEPELQAIFSELDARQAELRDVDHRMEGEVGRCGNGSSGNAQSGKGRSGNRPVSFLRKLLSGGRIGMLRAKRILLQRTLPGLYRRAGHAMCQAGLDDYVGMEAPSAVARAYWGNLEEQRELGRRRADLEKRRAGLMGELSELGAAGGVQGELARLAAELDQARRTATGAFGALGERAAKARRRDLPDDPDFDSVMSTIARARVRRTGKRRHIDRLEAAVEMDRIDAEVGRMRQRMRQEQVESDKHRQEADRLEKAIAEAEKTMEALSRKAGSRESLLTEGSKESEDTA